MKKPNIAALFNKFAGKEVPMREEERIFSGPLGSQRYTEVVLVNPADPTLQEMQTLADAHGLKLRVWFPGICGTADLRFDRINAYIEKAADGKYRVAKKFNIG